MEWIHKENILDQNSADFQYKRCTSFWRKLFQSPRTQNAWLWGLFQRSSNYIYIYIKKYIFSQTSTITFILNSFILVFSLWTHWCIHLWEMHSLLNKALYLIFKLTWHHCFFEKVGWSNQVFKCCCFLNNFWCGHNLDVTVTDNVNKDSHFYWIKNKPDVQNRFS